MLELNPVDRGELCCLQMNESFWVGMARMWTAIYPIAATPFHMSLEPWTYLNINQSSCTHVTMQTSWILHLTLTLPHQLSDTIEPTYEQVIRRNHSDVDYVCIIPLVQNRNWCLKIAFCGLDIVVLVSKTSHHHGWARSLVHYLQCTVNKPLWLQKLTYVLLPFLNQVKYFQWVRKGLTWTISCCELHVYKKTSLDSTCLRYCDELFIISLFIWHFNCLWYGCFS